MNPHKQQKLELTDRQAPILPGLYSTQAFGRGERTADVTVYRNTAHKAVSWQRSAVSSSLFSGFALRHATNEHHRNIYDIYDGKGKVTHRSCPDIFSEHIADVAEDVDVDRDAFTTEVREMFDDQQLSLVGATEAHVNSSAADISNITTFCRRLIIEAEDDDLEHTMFVDSKQWPCRVSGIFTRVDRLSPALQDAFLRCYRWVSKGWPVVRAHHIEVLAERLITVRAAHLRELLCFCGVHADFSKESVVGMLTRWDLSSAGARFRFVKHMLHVMKDAMVYNGRKAETFQMDTMKLRAADIIGNYRDIMV